MGRECVREVSIKLQGLTGSMFRLYVCLATTLSYKSKAAIVTPAMSQTSDEAYPICPDCSSDGSFSQLVHTAQLDLLLCRTCGRVHKIEDITTLSEVCSDE